MITFFPLRFIYLFKREKAQAGEQEGEGEGEAESPLSREPDSGFDPRTLKSPPEWKADA